MFVPKAKRITVQEEQRKAVEAEERVEKQSRLLEVRATETQRMVADVVRGEIAAEEQGYGGAVSDEEVRRCKGRDEERRMRRMRCGEQERERWLRCRERNGETEERLGTRRRRDRELEKTIQTLRY